MSVARVAAPSSCMQAAQAAEHCWWQPEGHNPSTSAWSGIDADHRGSTTQGSPRGMSISTSGPV